MPHSLGARIRAARRRTFVGRAAEREIFGTMLAGASPAAVLWIHGPGGIGKTALLRQLAEDARDTARTVTLIDLRESDPTPEAFREAPATGVLLIDTFERGAGLESWLRDEFLPNIAPDAVVVIAGRSGPSPDWRADPGWGELLQVLGLRNLGPEDAETFLHALDVPPSARAELLAYAGGHPLALSLGARSAREGAVTERGHDVIRTLLGELVGAVPSDAHQRALEICAHAFDTTEELLRAVLGRDAGARRLFDWLREQPYIEAGPHGLFPHDIVRDALDDDLRWRDPSGYAEMHRGIRRYLLSRTDATRGDGLLDRMRDLTFLHRHGGVMSDYITFQRRHDIRIEPYRDDVGDVVVALTERAEGPESARIAGFWLDRQPSAVSVFRRPGEPKPYAFMVWLRLTEPNSDEIAADPVVAAAWQHARSTGPLRAGEHIAVARFIVDPEAYQRPSATGDLVQSRILAEWLRADRLAWSYLVVADAPAWQGQMDYLDQHAVGRQSEVGGRRYQLFGHDWRAVPFDTWLDRHVGVELLQRTPPAPSSDLAVLSREEFNLAVREVLRAWRRPARIAANPLSRSRLAAADGDDRVANLRTTIGDAAAVLAGDPRTVAWHSALTTEYFHGVPSQEAAAERLGLPLSTYRRHLSRAVEELTDLLWHQELHGYSTADDLA
ncbi:ATP-binding protein [Actinoplanes sp. TBRC 11911]|uniref:ATP-binding protein n=1 Tax=Actinoplanes sp. TBRC 11911 TaxID=2729386 RepID=UPI00145C70F4|nr:ATP-binding protein [Actinoplanes sp. TBRC 11911]NMO55894.1 ATP-binding protein [Actinoplanes sp. TBRC 11911]